MSPIQSIHQLPEALSIAKQATILASTLTNEMDAELAAVKARFEGKIKARKDEAEAAIKAVEVYADAHRKELLSDGGKSITLNGHTLGWRDNGGAIKMARGQTEKKVLAKLLQNNSLRRFFVRTTYALDKEAMKSKWHGFRDRLTRLGVKYTHSESFFVELDVTEKA